MKAGISGILRAKNEGNFIGSCIDSCIDSLDELVIVYNDCTDDTERIIQQKASQYPDKIKALPYNHNVMVTNLSKEQFEYVSGLPEGALQLHATQCNYALDACSYEYAMKIDPDQIYFTDELSRLRLICKSKAPKFSISIVFGWMVMVYISIYRRISAWRGKPCLWMLSLAKVFPFFSNCYSKYCIRQLKIKKAALSLSGINVFYDGIWSIPFDGINIHPPYNGEGDTLLFAITDNTSFKKRCRDKVPYAVIESFDHQYKVLTWLSPIWFHFHANRPYCADKVYKAKTEHPEWFVEPGVFAEMSYKDVHNMMNHKSHTLFQRTLFGIIHTFGRKHLKPHLYMLDKYMPTFMKNQFKQ